MPRIATHELKQNEVLPQNRQVYCGLDSMLTHEIYGELSTLFNQPPEIYNFERALQAPLLEIMLRGFRVDEYERQKAIGEVKDTLARLEHILNRYAHAIWDKPLNPRSPDQLKRFFYSHMKLPEQIVSDKGKKRISTNRESLEKLEAYFYARPVVATILAIRDYAKQLSVLETEVDPDGRMRTSYNIGGTETNRLSSSSSVSGSGTNLQNLQKDTDDTASGKRISIRKLFISDYDPDDDWKLCGIDLEQTESHDVGWLHGTLLDDWTYLDAVEAGDVHTAVCKMIWKDLGWTDDKKHNRKLADQTFYRNFSFRDMAKRGGHASNYRSTPWTMARHLKIPLKLAEGFQDAYYGAFPAFPRWFQFVAQELQTKQCLTDPFGCVRHFFGRPNDDATLRAAIAHVPQTTTAKRMNLGLWRMWAYGRDKVQLLAQVHDAVYFQYRASQEAVVIPWALEQIKVPLTNGQRTMIVKGEAKIGWNWGNFNPISNPDGLIKWSLSTPDTRKRLTMLERTI